MGHTPEIWFSVKKHLEHRSRKRMDTPLNFYISVGSNSLDWYHGVDAFFWWYGAFVTIDASLAPKDEDGSLKADFILKPEDLSVLALDRWGKRVANLLKQRACHLKRRERGERRKVLHHLRDYLPDHF